MLTKRCKTFIKMMFTHHPTVKFANNVPIICTHVLNIGARLLTNVMRYKKQLFMLIYL